MELTRRRFLECASGALAMAALPRVSRSAHRESLAESSVECAMLDLEEECCIRESLAGYESAFAQLGVRATRVDGRSRPRSALIVIPAAVQISRSTGAMVRSSLGDGATVIVESGAVFTDAGSAEFRAHRDSLREELQLGVGLPVSLWPTGARAGGIPYVDYSWPVAARVRDFSRIVPLSSRETRDTIIARVGDIAVALMRRTGPGTLVFIGSPLGPALRYGDAEARHWLAGVSRTTSALSAA